MIEKLVDKIVEKDAPIVVGLDPQLSMIPEHIMKASIEKYGETLEAAGDAILGFNISIVDAVADLVPAVKPQIAMYERYGVPGLMAYENTIDYCHRKGLIVIADIKRGDIGSTSAAYADGHLGKVTIGSETYTPFDADFATVNPYLGTDGVKPFVDVAKENDRGLFILVKTSNPSSGEFQDKVFAGGSSEGVSKKAGVAQPDASKNAGAAQPDASKNAGTAAPDASQDSGKSLYELVADMVNVWGAESMHGGYSDIGAVVGATYPKIGEKMRSVMKSSYILVPGYGAQGGKGSDLKAFFNPDGLGAIVNSSRGIIAAWQKDAYKDRFDAKHFADASRQAVLDMKEDLNKNALGK